jgi:uncharacterized protein YdcH (DUF465 family)
MPKKVLNEKGEEIEVYTAEELEAERNKAIDDYKQANPGDPDIEKLQNEIQAKTEELEKLKNKDYNFSQLRETKERLEGQIADLTKSIDEKIGVAKKEVVEGVMKGYYNEKLKDLSGGNKELSDKIEFHYKRLTDPGTTKEEINKKLNDALILATGEGEGKSTSDAFSSKGVSPLGVEKGKPVTEEEKTFARKLGKAGGVDLTDEDFDKAKK